MEQQTLPHQIWLKCMQMAKCSKQQATQFIKKCIDYVNVPLTDSNQTLIIIASSIGNSFIVEQCVIRGANVNAKDTVGRSALHYAASIGSIQIFQMLRQKGANPIQLSIGGETPLSKACIFGQGDIIQWYLNNCIEAFEILDKCHKKPLQILKISDEDLYQEVEEVYKQLLKQAQL